MGVAFKELLKIKEISIDELKGKIIAVDTSIFLYQFLTTIRMRDGSVLRDSKGKITSHLSGLFQRSINLMEKGLKLVYVFDGETPELKKKEIERRKKLKEEAKLKYELAVIEEDFDAMRKYSAQTVKLTDEIIEESKELIKALGLPIVMAPAEAEAQASYMVKKGDCYAVTTQDSDSLMYGASRIVRNLSLLGKKKKYKTLSYKKIKPEMIYLDETLNELGINNDQLIVLAMLIGTDYNVGGIKGIGPKNALKLIKRFGKDFDKLFDYVRWDDYFDMPWTEVYYTIKNMPITDNYKLKWDKPNDNKIIEILVNKHDFSKERVLSSLKNLHNQIKQIKQKTLFDFT